MVQRIVLARVSIREVTLSRLELSCCNCSSLHSSAEMQCFRLIAREDILRKRRTGCVSAGRELPTPRLFSAQ